jgi:chemotaxis-related protein WspB
VSSHVLYLVVRLGADRYAIETAQVVEVVSLVRLKALPGAPAGVAGVMNYRDEPVPVIDLNLLVTGVPAAALTATRIVVVRYAPDAERSGVVGLLVPEASETLRLEPNRFTDPGVTHDGAPYLGPVLATAEGVIQRVSLSALLTAELRDALFPMAGTA